MPKITHPQKEQVKMKKMSLCIIMSGMFLSVSFGQEQTKYGLGLEFNTDPTLGYDGGLGIYVPINAGSLLIEPLIMYSSSSTEIDYDDYGYEDSKTSESDFTLLIGILKPTVRGKIRSYFGIRFGKQWAEQDSDNNNDDVENEYLIIAPTVGAEYYISDNFSFGGEAMYTMTTREVDDEGSYSTSKTTTYKNNVLIPKFIVRFYF